MTMFGMTGKMVRINLSNSQVSTFSTDPYIEYYLGGRGIASRLYWEEVPAEVKPFDPENKLIFVNGLLVGTSSQAATVMTVVAKSPGSFPESYCYGFFAGHVGAQLKKAGYDGMIIEGCAEDPVYVRIEDQKVTIQPAPTLWGKSAYTAGKAFEDTYGPKTQWMAIGIAGENLVRTAVVLASHESTLSCGFGAVMGSKKLKGIAVSGTGTVNVADRQRLVELTRYSYSISKRVHLAIPPQILRTGRGGLLEVVGKGHCFKCTSTCNRNMYRYGKRKDLTAMRRCQSIEYYLPWIYGKEDEPVDTLFDAPTLANDYSIDTFELENIVRWLYACHCAGALTDKEVGLPLSEIGTRDFLVKMLHAIAHREGFGDLLAEGQLRAGEKISSDAKALYSHQVNGVGQYETSPTRQFVVQSLLIPMEPRAHQPLLHATSFVMVPWRMNMQNPDSSPINTKVFHKVAKAFWGSEAAGDISGYEGKPLAAVLIQNRVYLHDSLGLCNFTWPITYSFNTPDHVGDPFLEGKLFSAVTGLPENRLEVYAKRIVDLQRAILVREGRQLPEADYPREFQFTEPLMPKEPVMSPGPNGPIDISGNKLDRKLYELILQEYYAIRQWDPYTGMPKAKIPTNL
jgi:aldehyde:ferredoxin oxidoreductase